MAEGRSEPYATVEELVDMLDRHKGTPGIRKARLALEDSRVGADSAPETRLRLILGRAGLPEPHLNRPALLRPGVVREPDLSYPEYRVAVEYEGEAVHSATGQVVRDIARDEDYASAGWTSIRISKRHLEKAGHAAVAKVRTALYGHGWQPR